MEDGQGSAEPGGADEISAARDALTARADLAARTSAYIGETEKHVSAVLERAEAAGWTLFFDESDALFGGRTDVGDSHDRYADLETAFLLSRLDLADYAGGVHRIYRMPFAKVYPLYVAKVERKGRTTDELDQVIEWLTGFDHDELRRHIEECTTFEDFFADAQLNPNASQITGVICGMRVEHIEDPLMQRIRYLDKLVDELARGKAMEKILRGSQA